MMANNWNPPYSDMLTSFNLDPRERVPLCLLGHNLLYRYRSRYILARVLSSSRLRTMTDGQQRLDVMLQDETAVSPLFGDGPGVNFISSLSIGKIYILTGLLPQRSSAFGGGALSAKMGESTAIDVTHIFQELYDEFNGQPLGGFENYPTMAVETRFSGNYPSLCGVVLNVGPQVYRQCNQYYSKKVTICRFDGVLSTVVLTREKAEWVFCRGDILVLLYAFVLRVKDNILFVANHILRHHFNMPAPLTLHAIVGKPEICHTDTIALDLENLNLADV